MFGGKIASLFIDIIVRTQQAQNQLNNTKRSIHGLVKAAALLYIMEQAFAAVGHAIADVAKTVGDIEANFGVIKRVTSMATAELEDFKQKLFEVSDALKGVGLQDFQKTVSAAAQLGFKGEQLLEFSEVAAKLASVSTDLDFQESARALGVFLNVFGEGTDRANELAGALLRVSNESNATSGQIINISERLAGYAATVGLTAEQTFALAAATKDAGVKNEVAASSLIALLRTLTSEPQKVAEILGLTGDALTKFTANVDVAPMEAIMQFFEELRTMPPAKVSTVLKDLGVGDVRQLPTLQSLARTYESLQRNLDIVADAQANNNKLTQDTTDRAGELNSKIIDLTEAWERFKESLGALEVFKNVVDQMTELLKVMKDVNDFANSDDWSNLLFGGINGIAEAFGNIETKRLQEEIRNSKNILPEKGADPNEAAAKAAERERLNKESQDFRAAQRAEEDAKKAEKAAKEAEKLAAERRSLEENALTFIGGEKLGGQISQLFQAQSLISDLRNNGMLNDGMLSLIKAQLNMKDSASELKFQDPTQFWKEAQKAQKDDPNAKKVIELLKSIAEQKFPDLVDAVNNLSIDAVGP